METLNHTIEKITFIFSKIPSIFRMSSDDWQNIYEGGSFGPGFLAGSLIVMFLLMGVNYLANTKGDIKKDEIIDSFFKEVEALSSQRNEALQRAQKIFDRINND